MSLITALLIDGSNNPPALRIDTAERKEYITQGRANELALNYKFDRMIGDVAVYRIVEKKLPDDEFERMAKAEADKFNHPENYPVTHVSSPLSNKEREELEELRKLKRGK